jgi:hypothetical protein
MMPRYDKALRLWAGKSLSGKGCDTDGRPDEPEHVSMHAMTFATVMAVRSVNDPQ